MSPLYKNVGIFTVSCIINWSMFRLMLRDNEINKRLTEKHVQV